MGQCSFSSKSGSLSNIPVWTPVHVFFLESQYPWFSKSLIKNVWFSIAVIKCHSQSNFYRKGGLFGPTCSDILSSTRHFLPSLPRHQYQLLTKHLNAGDCAGGISFNPHNQALGLIFEEALM